MEDQRRPPWEEGADLARDGSRKSVRSPPQSNAESATDGLDIDLLEAKALRLATPVDVHACHSRAGAEREVTRASNGPASFESALSKSLNRP
jgi:hypothetical protein